MERISEKKRYNLLDSLRGLTLISMILYHGTWDLVYLYGVDWQWYHGTPAYIWQQSICWTFILLSGFCWSMGRHHLKRGLMVFGGGAIITLVTLIAMPENRVVFGVLTLLGSCMLLMIPLHKLLEKINPWLGLVCSGILFTVTRDVNIGFFGFEGWKLMKLPRELYHNLVSTFLGFPEPEFFSTDYFSLVPWMFLFLVGYFLFQGLRKMDVLEKNEMIQKVLGWKVPVLSFIGRHSLIIYMAHQAVLYVILQTVFQQW